MSNSLRERIYDALGHSLDRCARCKICDHQVDAVLAAVDGELVRQMEDLQAEVQMLRDRKEKELERERILTLLRRAAAGRREYAGRADDGHESRPLLLRSADGFDEAALLVENPRYLMGIIPSWQWTAEEHASIHEKPELCSQFRGEAQDGDVRWDERDRLRLEIFDGKAWTSLRREDE